MLNDLVKKATKLQKSMDESLKTTGCLSIDSDSSKSLSSHSDEDDVLDLCMDDDIILHALNDQKALSSITDHDLSDDEIKTLIYKDLYKPLEDPLNQDLTDSFNVPIKESIKDTNVTQTLLKNTSESSFKPKKSLKNTNTNLTNQMRKSQGPKESSDQQIFFNLNISDFVSTHLENSSMAYLNIRMASLPQPIETCPIFITRSSKSHDFHFNYTLPIVQLDSLPEIPLIVEVWTIADVPHLLGLVKLPLTYLFELSRSSKSEFTQPLFLPRTQYSIVDVLNGKTVGWLSCFLALGKYEQIIALNESAASRSQNVSSYVSSCISRSLSPTVSNPHSIPSTITNLKDQAVAQTPVVHILKENNHSNNQFVSNLPAENQTIKKESVVFSISLHKATGLKALIPDNKSVPNTRIRFTLFPANEFEYTAEYDEDSTLETQIISHSFHPLYDHHVEMTVDGLNTDLIQWIRKGGSARGEVLDETSQLIGVFSVPLECLLMYSEGMQNEWIRIVAPTNKNNLSDSTFAAICLSIQLVQGYDDLAQISPISIDQSAEFHINSLLFSKCHPSISLEKQVLIEWINPNTMEKCKSSLHSWTLEDDYYISENIPLGSLDLKNLTSRKLLLECWLVHQHKCELLGNIHLDLVKVMDNYKHHQRRIKRASWESNFVVDIINETASDLYQASAEICCKITKKKIPHNTNSFKNPSLTNSYSPMAVSSTTIQKEEEITFKSIDLIVKIDRAMHLPLMKDVSILNSPFVRQNESQLAPPSCLVLFEWIDSFGKSLQFSTDKIPHQTSPIWNQSFTIPIPIDLNFLQTLKTKGLITFSIWHLMDEKREIKEFVGQAQVDISTLFYGLDKIHGWYPVQMSSGTSNSHSKSSLMVEIFPLKSLKEILKDLSDSIATLEESQLPKNEMKSGVDPITEESKVHPSLSASIAAATCVKDQPIDTWIWNGNQWQHKSVNSCVQPCEVESEYKPFEKTVSDLQDLTSRLKQSLSISLTFDPNINILVLDSKKEYDDGIFYDSPAKCISKTSINQEDSNKILHSVHPIHPIHQEKEMDLDLERMDRILRISRSWICSESESGINTTNAMKPLTLDELEPLPTKDEGVCIFVFVFLNSTDSM